MHRLIYLTLLLVLLGSSCSNYRSQHSYLTGLDSLCNKDPEYALGLLKELTDNATQLCPEDKMYWHLLCTKAQDKAFIPHTSDSIMKKVVAYYDKKGSVYERAEAHYYLASVYRDLHNSPRAIVEFLKAIHLLHDNRVYFTKLMVRCYSQLSHLYNEQLNYDEALRMAQKSVDLGKRYQELTPTLVADMANAYLQLNDTLSAISSYQEACKLILKKGIEQYYSTAIVAEAMSVFSAFGMMKDADKCFLWLSALDSVYYHPNIVANKAIYYENKGLLDSAIVYYRKKYQSTYYTAFSKQEAARSLMNIYYHLGQLDSASYYGQLYAAASDSVDNFLKIEQTRNARNEYQYQRDMEAEAKAYQEASVARMRLVLFVGFAAISTLAGILYHVNRKRVMAQKLLEKEGIIQEQRHTLLQKDETLNETKQRLEKRQAQNERLTQMMLAAGSERMNDDVIGLFKAAAKGKRVDITEETWQQLMAALDREYPDFCSRIMERWPTIGNNALHIACLHKLGMSNAEAFTVLGIPRSTFYRLAHQVDEQLGE